MKRERKKKNNNKDEINLTVTKLITNYSRDLLEADDRRTCCSIDCLFVEIKLMYN